MKKLFFVTMFCLLIFASCKSAINNEETKLSLLDGVSDTDLVTPYTDMSLLENTRSATMSDPDVVNWKVARFFAVVKKIESEDIYPSWKGSKISEKPIAIYHPKDNTLMYYEFRVVKDGKELGSITCHARKEVSNPVAYVSEMTNKVAAKVAKGIIKDELKLVAVNYPGKFIVEQNNTIKMRGLVNVENVDFKNAITTEKLDIDSIIVPIKTKEILETSNIETLRKIGIDESEKIEMLEKVKIEEEEAKIFWNAIDEGSSEILAMSDEEIESIFRPKENINSETGITTKHIYATVPINIDVIKLYDWYDKRDWIGTTEKDGDQAYCYIHELALIVMGGGKKSNFSVIPSKYDDDSVREKKIEDIYNIFRKELKLTESDRKLKGIASIKNARTIRRLSKALRNRSNYSLEKHGSNAVLIDDHIRNFKLPVISLRVGGLVRYKDLAMHYRTIVGSKRTYIEYKRKFLWWPIRSTYGYDYEYLITDNGSDGRGFWEIASTSYQIKVGLVKTNNSEN